MKISRVQLHNFRNYKDVVLELGSETTLLFGDNGTGKSNLLKAIKQLLSFVFSKRVEDSHFDFLASSSCKINGLKSEDARYGKDSEDHQFIYHFPIRTTLEGSLESNGSNAEHLEWAFEQESREGKPCDSLYRDATIKFWKHYDNGKGELPVLAYFPDCYPIMNLRLQGNIVDMLRSGNPLPRNVGYFKWDNIRNDPQLWVVHWMMQYKNSIFSHNPMAAEYAKSVTEALIRSSQPISKYNPEMDFVLRDVKVELRPTGDVMVLEYENGTQIPFMDLPSSHFRFFSIILDIASRSYLLNKNCDPSGIVLIDGLDLHLHPTEQRTILKRLRSTFPKIQWIVTTQSPLVLSSFEQKEGSNEMYKLSKKDNTTLATPIGNAQGVDVDTILEYTMDTPQDDSRLEDYKEAYEYWRSKGDKGKMANIKERIKDIVGEDGLLYTMLESSGHSDHSDSDQRKE